MTKSTPAITLRNGAAVISELEARHRAAEGTFAGASAAMQAASAKYEAALGEGRDAVIAARQLCTDAKIDLDIARRSVEVLAVQVATAHEALRLAGVEHKLAEVERTRRVFETTVRQRLPAMGVDGRAIIRAWAEAEFAIEEARQAQGAGGPEIPSAESFRRVPRVERKELRRIRITRWLRSGSGDTPYPDEVQKEIVREGDKGRNSNGAMVERGEFDRITYAAAVPAINVPLLIESLSIPALIGGQTPGWHPTEAAHPHTVLAWLADLERAPAPKAVEEETVDVFVRRVGAEPEAALA